MKTAGFLIYRYNFTLYESSNLRKLEKMGKIIIKAFKNGHLKLYGGVLH
jgi:hypothetical protein